MSEEKQIEEMAKIIGIPCYKRIEAYGDGSQECPSPLPCNECTAELLYKAGYRKQIEAEWIEEHGKTYIPAEYDENGYLILHDYTTNVCSVCGRREPKKEPYCNCGAKMGGGAE